MSKIVFLMLNPSTADGLKDDPTIRKCMKFAVREGFLVGGPAGAHIDPTTRYRYTLWRGDLVVVNLLAWRATEPLDLLLANDPVGADNNEAIVASCRGADLVIAAWGNLRPKLAKLHWREMQVRSLLSDMKGLNLRCLKLNGDGSPGHPLYLKDSSPLLAFTP